MPDTDSNPAPPKIRFNDAPPIGQAIQPEPGQDAEPTEAPVAGTSVAGSTKIRTFEKKGNHEEKWLRTPNQTGSGATHVRTFHSKLNTESLAYMDAQINDWLAEHPEVEVKFVSSTVGVYSGKVKEPAIICHVWV